MVKFTDMYHINPLWAIKNSVQLKTNEWTHSWMLQRHFYNNKLTCKFGNEIKGLWGNQDELNYFNPTLSFTSK